jgi:hypothetical protein
MLETQVTPGPQVTMGEMDVQALRVLLAPQVLQEHQDLRVHQVNGYDNNDTHLASTKLHSVFVSDFIIDGFSHLKQYSFK